MMLRLQLICFKVVLLLFGRVNTQSSVHTTTYTITTYTITTYTTTSISTIATTSITITITTTPFSTITFPVFPVQR